MVDVVPTHHIVKHTGGGNPGVYPLPGSQILGSQVGADLDGAALGPLEYDSILTNRRCVFLDDEYALHGDQANSNTNGVFRRGLGDDWVRSHQPTGTANIIAIASGLHVVHPFGVPTLAFLYFAGNVPGGPQMRYASTTDGVNWSDIQILTIGTNTAPTTSGMSIVWRKAIVWGTSRVTSTLQGRSAWIYDTELQTIIAANGHSTTAPPVNSGAERALHVHNNALFALGERDGDGYHLRRFTGTFFDALHEEPATTGNFPGASRYGHSCLFSDPASGSMIAVFSGGQSATSPATVGGAKVVELPSPETDSSPATTNDISSTVMGATHGADKYLTGGGAANLYRRWWVIADNQTSPGSVRIFLLTSTSGGVTEAWQWMGIGAEMEPIAGLVGITNDDYALNQTAQGGGERYPNSGYVALEGIPGLAVGGTRFQFRGRKTPAGTVSFRASSRGEPAATLVPIVAGSLTIGAGLLTDLEAYYHFNDDGVDASGNGLTVTLQGAATYAAGKFGNGLSLDGSNTAYADRASHDASLAFDGAGQAFGVGAWVNPNNLDEAEQNIADMRTAAGGDGWTLKVSTDGTLRFTVAGVASYDSAAGEVAVGSLQYVLATSDGVTLKMYVDAVEVFSGAIGVISLGAEALQIGGRIGAGHAPWDGVIDDIAFWSRYITPTEAGYIYNAGSGFLLEGTTPFATPPSINGNTIDDFTCDNGATLYSVILDVGAAGISEGSPGTMIAILT